MPEPATDCAVEVDGLVMRYGEKLAVDDLSLTVERHTITAVLGPNGAGKTTTLRMLATLSVPDGGTARLLGHDVVAEPDAVRSRVSLTGQFASLDEDLTGRENMVLLGLLLGLGRRRARARAVELVDAFGLTEAADRQVKTYSGGMRRRLDIAASLVVTPDVLFLDEPTTGLDPRSRNQVWDIIRALVTAGTTVLLTTQYLDEADQLADRIAVIDRGRVIAEGTPGQLKASVGGGSLHLRVADPDERFAAVRILSEALGTEVAIEADPAAVSARLEDAERVAHGLVELSRAGISVSEMSLGQPSLDEVFLALTDHPATTPDDTEEAA
ncbi:MAG TPA: ATP-binding cassette domain-containing protein [Acidimicrobiales bacterium]|nr:ATP-binding cassette domain-containing protein [Acidimicrobiales bacterium]